MVEVLFDDPLLRVTIDRDARLVRYERTTLPFPHIEDVSRVHDALVTVVLGLPRGAYAIVLDLRQAPPRNDDEYESTVEGYIDLLFRHFRTGAILVRTAAGRLQVARMEKRANRPPIPVFHEEADALAHIAKG